VGSMAKQLRCADGQPCVRCGMISSLSTWVWNMLGRRRARAATASKSGQQERRATSMSAGACNSNACCSRLQQRLGKDRIAVPQLWVFEDAA
jgi:hypothetical protein